MDEQADKNEILSKIKACLNLASSKANTTESEMATALGMAKRLMARYNLSEAEVIAHDPTAAEASVDEVTLVTRLNPHAYEQHLSMVCKDLFSVEPLLFGTTVNGKPRRVIKFYGLPTDIAVASAAYTLLRDEINKMALDCGFEGTQRDQWRVGVVHRLRMRAKDMATGLSKEEENQCRGLMVVKNQMIKAHIDKSVGKVRAAKTRTSVNDAYRAGMQDGNKINLDFSNKVGGSSAGHSLLS